jgi:RimJ/RimL family protein N-acetyltransferase
MVIETKNLIIRNYTLKDTDELFLVLSDAKTMQFWQSPFTMEDIKIWINKSLESYDTNGFGRYAVIIKGKQKIIGDCGIMKLKVIDEIVNDLGYIIHSKYWGKGYGTESANAVKEYAFNVLGLNALYANMPYNHKASIKIAEKIGMKKVKEFNNEKNRNIKTFLYRIYNG